jgi:enediyne biosynthesis protein E4
VPVLAMLFTLMRLRYFVLFLISLSAHAQKDPLFQQLPGSKTGVTFKNTLHESATSNVLTYEYFYNGGGVAVGDINNDGLDDIFFTANMKPNALYLNQGNMKFKDITRSAGVLCENNWKTGVTMADVNADGFLDIYVCFSGKGDPEKRRNKLFINNGDLTFTEKAKEFGLDDPGHSTHASFFDSDNDGDLDMYLLNHNVTVIREFEFAKAKQQRHPYAGDKLFRNDNGHFTDVSESAGIKGNPLGFGLGVSVADINKDGWMDIYVSNDYIEPDYVYINNKNGTFTDKLSEYMQHISYFSMGCDVSDINNDAWPEIFTVDMLPEDNKRQKLLYGPENYEHYALMVLNGFYFQNMRNMLHLNNGNGTYSEIGQYAGVSNTDWSWAPLFADYDNDGWKDLFITNGYYRDYTNRDFLKYKGDYYFKQGVAGAKADTFHLISTMTSTPVRDYMYKNNGDLTFADKSVEWGFKEPNFSNGAAFADLDNDGDLELVVNNENATASVFKNLTRERNPQDNFLQLDLRGSGKNTFALGAKISIYSKGRLQYFEHIPTRGFQSCTSHRIHAGLGDISKVDSVTIEWLSGSRTVVTDVNINQINTIREGTAIGRRYLENTRLHTFFSKSDPVLNFEHVEQGFNDFKRQPLLMTMLTPCGPIMAKGDVNGDGRDDVYVGGAQGSQGRLFIQNTTGSFDLSQMNFGNQYTDADAVFFDADGDKDADLYVVSGGYNEYKENDKALQDRLYVNDGKGNFTSFNNLPAMLTSKSCVAASDFDHDGDVDVFVGGRVVPGKYPVTPPSFLLRNNAGVFQNVAEEIPSLSNVGMVTDAEWVDVNNDGWDDLVIVGEFMEIELFTNKNGKLERSTKQAFNEPLFGLWNKLTVADFDADGDKDIIAANFGLNSQLKASVTQPVTVTYKDFDNNGSVDPMLTFYVQGKPYPFASRDELLDQMYSMRSRYTSYASYADAQLQSIFSASDLKDAQLLKANTLETVYLENKDGKFIRHALPREAQYASVYAMTVEDFNKDGNLDLLLAGNQSSIRIRLGVIDANFGQLFLGDGKGNFTYVPQAESGLNFTGDTKSLLLVNVNGAEVLLQGVNNVGVQCYKWNSTWQGSSAR